MNRRSSTTRLWRALVGTVTVATLAGCGTGPAAGTVGRGGCPVEPISVVVSVAQWADVVGRLGGGCVRLTTIVRSSSVDPHGFDPSPADIASFSRARLVVLNGLGYDSWARRAVDSVGTHPVVVDAGAVVGRRTGENPHIWYSPEAVVATASAVSAALVRLLPRAADDLAARHAAWVDSLAPYEAEIARIRDAAGRRTYAATEPVFDDMAAALGLRDVTPEAYRHAAGNETEPPPVAVADLLDVLRRHRADVLVVNSQTEGAITDELRDAARNAGVPIVGVTESMPPSSSFVDWQVAQLRALSRALGR